MRSMIGLILLFATTTGYAQEFPRPLIHQEPIYDMAPRYPGGSDAMMKFLADSIRYPEPKRIARKQGNVQVAFNVNELSEVIDIHIMNGVLGAPRFVEETILVLQSMPRWEPATKDGRCVTASVTVSIPFKLHFC